MVTDVSATRQPPRHDAARGFTFIEVLIALVVVALGLAAVAKQTGQSARTARIVQSKTLANWIALNKLTELRLIEGVPSAGTDSDEIEYAGRNWFWESEIIKPSDDVNNFMRVEVSVALADSPEDIIAVVTGFIGRGPSAAGRQPWDVRTGGASGGAGGGTDDDGRVTPAPDPRRPRE